MDVVVAEKSSVERSLRSALKNTNYHITSVSGHISRLEFNKWKVAPWLKVKPIELLDDSLICKYNPQDVRGLSNLNSIGAIDTLILACDPDVEGDKIAYDVWNYLSKKHVIRKVKLVKLESLTSSGIVSAFNKMTDVDVTRLGLAGSLRSRLDLWFGAILSRFTSIELYRKMKKWDTYNVGRVQTPTLEFVIRREAQIESFRSRDYYVLQSTEKKTFPSIELSKKFVTIEPGTYVGTVKLSNKEQLEVKPFEGLNTDSLITLLSREHAEFKSGGSIVTTTLSNMYLKGLISYPRTDNKYFNNYRDELVLWADLWGVQHRTKPIIPTLEPDNVVRDHAPIHPLCLISECTDPLYIKVLTTLYRYGCKVFTGSNKYVRKTYQVKFTDLDYEPTFTILEVLEKNFEDGRTAYNESMPDHESLEFKVVPKTTHPPVSYTPISLLNQMKKHNIGTKSTRTAIIENLQKNGYFYNVKTHLKPFKKAKILSTYWNNRNDMILKPDLTTEIEACFDNLKSDASVTELESYYKLKLREIIRSDTTT